MADKRESSGFLGRLLDRLTGKVPQAASPTASAPQAAAAPPAPLVIPAPEAAEPFQAVRVPGAQALEALKLLATQGRGYPVLVGPQEELDRLLESFEFSKDDNTENLLREAQALDPLAWLRARAEGDADHYEESHGPWPEGEDEGGPGIDFGGHLDIRTRRPYPEVIILLVPAEYSWQVPCVLRYGNWNDCPEAVAHGAVMRMWEKEYGAKVVTISGDVIEMSVERPPATREAALALARQQFIYCADIVDQGVGTIEALAAALLNSRAWYFWWD